MLFLIDYTCILVYYLFTNTNTGDFMAQTQINWFQIMFDKVKAKVDWYLETFEHSTYQQAKAEISKGTVAGADVWAELDKLYTGDAPFQAWKIAMNEARTRINN